MTVGADNNWDQDLADILNIVAEDGCENSATRWPCPGQDIQDPKLINPMVHCSRKEPQNQPLSPFESAYPFLYTKVRSNGSVFPVNDTMVIDHIDQNDNARIVPNSTITVNNTDFNRTSNARYNSYGMDSAQVQAIEATSCGVKRFTENQGRHKLKSSSPIVKRKSRIAQKNRNQLFGILSLILQAFHGPLTSELEERYISVLQKALSEIEIIRFKFLQQSRWKQT